MSGGLSGFPVVGKEFFEAAHGMIAETLEDVAEVGKGIDPESTKLLETPCSSIMDSRPTKHGS